MLVFIGGSLIEVVTRGCYKGILAFCSPIRKALLGLKSSPMGEPVHRFGKVNAVNVGSGLYNIKSI